IPDPVKSGAGICMDEPPPADAPALRKKPFSYFDRPALDLAGARRDYISAKRGMYVSISITLAVVLSLLGGCEVLVAGLQAEDESVGLLCIIVLPALIVIVVGCRRVRASWKEAGAIPYVPPVPEQVAA